MLEEDAIFIAFLWFTRPEDDEKELGQQVAYSTPHWASDTHLAYLACQSA